MKKVRVNEQHLFEVDGDLVKRKGLGRQPDRHRRSFLSSAARWPVYTIEVLQDAAENSAPFESTAGPMK